MDEREKDELRLFEGVLFEMKFLGLSVGGFFSLKGLVARVWILRVLKKYLEEKTGGRSDKDLISRRTPKNSEKNDSFLCTVSSLR